MRRMMLLVMIAMPFLGAAACAPRIVTIDRAVPADVQLKLSRVSGVWIAGFHVTNNREVDLNVETVHLLRNELRRATSLDVIEADPLVITAEQVFMDRAYWKRLAAEHRSSLVVTGTISFLVAPAKTVERGRNTYVSTAGRVLAPAVVIIDGTTGEVLLREQLPRRVQYGIGRSASTLSLYFELMHLQMADWLRVIGAGALASSATRE